MTPREVPGRPPPPDLRVLCLRAIPCAILGALAGAGFAVWLTLSHRIGVADAGIVGSEMPLAGAALGASFYMWWATRRWWAHLWDREDRPPAP